MKNWFVSTVLIGLLALLGLPLAGLLKGLGDYAVTKAPPEVAIRLAKEELASKRKMLSQSGAGVLAADRQIGELERQFVSVKSELPRMARSLELRQSRFVGTNGSAPVAESAKLQSDLAKFQRLQQTAEELPSRIARAKAMRDKLQSNRVAAFTAIEQAQSELADVRSQLEMAKSSAIAASVPHGLELSENLNLTSVYAKIDHALAMAGAADEFEGDFQDFEGVLHDVQAALQEYKGVSAELASNE